MNKKICVSGCSDCPFKRNHYGHGENWNYCSHKDSPEGYGNILESNNPEWCPLDKASLLITKRPVEKTEACTCVKTGPYGCVVHKPMVGCNE